MISRICAIRPSAKGVEHRDIELHGAVVVPLAEEGANIHRDRVTLGDDVDHLAAHAGIAGIDRAPHLPHRGLALPVAHMRHDVDGGVGDEIDVVTAIGQRAFEIAGIEYIEKIQYALPVELCDQCSFSAGVAPDRHFQVHCGPNFAAINRQKFPPLDPRTRKTVHNPRLYFQAYGKRPRAGSGDTAPSDAVRQAPRPAGAASS